MRIQNLPSLLLFMTLAIRSARAQEDPPNIDQVTYSVNMLVGLPVAQQRRAYIGKKLFHLNRNADATVLHNGYSAYQEITDFTNAESCTYTEQETYFYWSMSDSSLSAQSSSSSKGKDQSVDLGVTVPVGPAEVSASTSIRNALVFGNSDSSASIKAKKKSGQSRSYSAKGEGRLYSAKVDYSKITKWDSRFKDALATLKSSNNEVEFFKFFKKFGTHGLERVGFGQICTTSMFMSEGQSVSVYADTVTEVTTKDTGFYWFHHETSESQTETDTSASVDGTKYTISNKSCTGSLSRGSACMPGIGKDVPEILNWSLKPIWEMDVPDVGFDANTKNAMKTAFNTTMTSAVECARNYCSSHGACVPNLSEWLSVGSVNTDNLFAHDHCFCANGWEGDRCDIESQEDPTEPPPKPDTGFKFKTGQIIGLYSLKQQERGKGYCWIDVIHSKGDWGELFNWQQDISSISSGKKWKVEVVDDSDVNPVIRLEANDNKDFYIHANYEKKPCKIVKDGSTETQWRVYWQNHGDKLLKLESVSHPHRFLDSNDGKNERTKVTDNTNSRISWYVHLIKDV